ncbi:regulatory signaling modulator protein AmpE [Alteromonas ponticola]|uniref:Regulatory signaling modulator protein AmpE n=1 Tax=Alteromonas aquimaris TaxID=2998417 RepID=A0ABT3P4P1_9ALTE|nr:regulatory signaling modulator protein AmpE [Alteromonas aquimaris]MCW8107086.1 regulatory signaling modulator protein AmpE [Alteromonas aquimaris]
MTLIIILIALVLDRTISRNAHLYSICYTSGYAKWLTEKRMFSASTKVIALALAIILPVLMTHLLTSSLSGVLLFLLECVILFVGVRHATLPHHYHAYRAALTRNDAEACYLYAGKILPATPANNSEAINRAMGRELAYLNYQYYAAVIIWYAAFGATGVVLYVLLRDWKKLAKKNNKLPVKQLETCAEWLDYVPARIASAIYLFIGDFTRALPTWLKYLTNVSVSARHVITHIATKATADNEVMEGAISNPASYVDLSKRTVKTLVVIVAFLTILGLVE